MRYQKRTRDERIDPTATPDRIRLTMGSSAHSRRLKTVATLAAPMKASGTVPRWSA